MSILEQRESHKGFHFYTSYLDCPRKFYIRYVLGLRPEVTSVALIFGKIVHEVAYEFVFKNDLRVAPTRESFIDKIGAEKLNYPDQEKYLNDRAVGEVLLEKWMQKTNEEIATNKIIPLMGEQELEVPIGPQGIYTMTIRPDMVFKDREKDEILVKDYKTTGWSVGKTLEGLDKDDQMTCYIWGLQKKHPEMKITSGVGEVLYKRGQKVEVVTGDPIYRSEYDISAFEVSLTGIISEVSQKKEALFRDQLPAEMLFPRHGAFCKLFGCEYEPICRGNLKHFQEDPKKVPMGFTRDDFQGANDDK